VIKTDCSWIEDSFIWIDAWKHRFR